MNKRKKKQNLDAVYKSKPEFRNHLEERLQHEQLYKKKTFAGKDLTQEEQTQRHNFYRMKNYYLDTLVFPSMANIITFLEYAARPELQEYYEDDIEELLLGIPKAHYDKKLKDYTKYEDQTVIARFLAAILSLNSKWRPLLFPIIQRAITSNIHGILYDLLGPQIFNLIILNDFGRAEALAVLVGKDTRIKTEMPDRPVNF